LQPLGFFAGLFLRLLVVFGELGVFTVNHVEIADEKV
jgi:hypothetical protein